MIVAAFLELAAVVVLLYVSELIVYLPPGRVGLVVRGKRSRLVRGFGFKSPLPWSGFYNLDDFHLQLGTTGAFAYSPHRIDSRKPLGFGRAYTDYADFNEVTTRDKQVLLDGTLFVNAVSAKAAERMKRELDEVKRAPPTKRDKYIRKLIEDALEPESAVTVRTEDDKQLSSLRLFATLHMAVVVTLLTMCVFGRIERWPYMLATLALTLLFSVSQFASAYKKLWPRDRANRWNRLFVYLVTPLPVIKSADYATRERMADLHMFAAMRAFMKPEKVGPLLQLALRDTQHPGSDTWNDPDPKARAAQDEHRATFAKVLAGVAPAESAATTEEGIVAKCPRCGAGYTRVVATCFDCGAAIATPSQPESSNPRY